MSQPYKSGRQQDLNLGITSVTENRTVLQTIGKVGIGTTNAQNHSLFVVGSTNIIGDVNITGISTLNDVVADNLDLVNIDASGIGTIANLDVQTSFNVYAPGATFHQDLTVLGNVNIGGTTQVLIGQELRIKDKEIILGVTTAPGDPTGDYSNDDTANHGGIAIASTVGSPLVPLKVIGINTLPDTYKQIMWVKSNTMGFGTTDAWLFNYAVGIGSTLVPNGVRLAVGGVQVTDHSITAQTGNFNILNTTNLYTSGVGTVVTLDSTTSNILNLNVTNANINIGIVTNISGTNLYYSGVGSITTLNSTDATITNLSGDRISIVDINSTGVVTATKFDGNLATIVQGNITSASGTNLNYTGISTLSTVTTNQLTSANINVVGVVTARQFIGDINAGVATITQGNIANVNATTLNVSGISTINHLYVAGLSTFVGVTTHQSTVFGTQLSISGFSTLSTLHAPKLTYNGSDFGGTGYLPKADGSGGWVWADIPGIFSVNNILNGFNVEDEGLIVGTAGSITTLDFRGVNIVATADTQPNGIATIRLSETPTFLTLDVSGISTFAGITTVTGDTLFAKQLNISGVSTFAGIGTFNSDLYVGGNLYIQNDLVFDEATLRNINITGISTLGIATASQLYVSGVTTTGNLTVNSTSLFQGGIQANSTISALGGVDGNLTGNVTSTGSNSFGQANVTGVVTARQFIGDINAGVATITQGNITNASGSTLSYTGLSTITDISSAGISVSGVVTARQFVGDISAGVGTITSLNSTSANLTNINSSGISTLNVISANEINLNNINVTGVVTARQFIGDVQAGVATITQGNITNANGSTLNYIGLSTITDISSAGIRVSGVVTARQFIGDINAGIATITQGNITNASGSTLSYIGLSTITDISSAGIRVSGVVTARQFVGDINAGIATITTIFGTEAFFTGNVSIGGTLSYEDVTNVDSIGVITARSDVRVGGNLSVVGVTTLASAGGITTTGGDFYVGDDLFFKGNLYQNGQLFAAGIGIGSTSVNPGSGLINTINNRIGVGFTDINIVGTGISVTGYGSTVVIDFGNIAAASGGALSISTVFSPRIQDVSFVGGASTSIIGISTQTDRFVFDTQTGSVGIGTFGSSIPAYKLDVVGDINTSTSVKVKGVDVLEEAVRLAIAFG